MYNLVFYGGLNSEKYLEEFLGQLLKDKGFDPDITFKQLHDSQKTNIDGSVASMAYVQDFH